MGQAQYAVHEVCCCNHLYWTTLRYLCTTEHLTMLCILLFLLSL